VPKLRYSRACSAWLPTKAAAIALCGTLFTATAAIAKLPGVVHCYNDICHRVRTVAETEARRGIVEPLVASFYDSPEKDRFNPSLDTSSGMQFKPEADDNAASPIHPDGTVLLVWSPATRGAAIIRVNNAGPYYSGRTLDVSRGVADRLGFANGGVMQLLSVVIYAPTEPEAHYVRHRVYPTVQGYLGKFDNIALASLQDPVARLASAPLVDSRGGMAPSVLIAQHVTAEHFRLTELALAFLAAPSDLMPAPHDQLIQ
jgi:rare lipoprotein A